MTGLADESTGEQSVVIERRMEERFFQIDTVLRNYGAAEKNCADMGTTLSVLFLLSEKGLIAHVGDSRIYRLRNTTLQRLTTDHSFIQELIDKGLLSEEIRTVLEASPTPQKAAEHLLHLALERGGRDNATAIVAFLE